MSLACWLRQFRQPFLNYLYDGWFLAPDIQVQLVQPARVFGFLPESAATILAIWLRRWLNSSWSSVVRLRAGNPGFFRASSFSSCFRKLGTEAFRWMTKSGLGFHLCLSGRESVLEAQNPDTPMKRTQQVKVCYPSTHPPPVQPQLKVANTPTILL